MARFRPAWKPTAQVLDIVVWNGGQHPGVFKAQGVDYLQAKEGDLPIERGDIVATGENEEHWLIKARNWRPELFVSVL